MTVTGSTFTGNSAVEKGGGLFNFAVTFINEAAGGDGGGVANGPVGTVTVRDCTFTGNSADSGGGLYNDGDGDGERQHLRRQLRRRSWRRAPQRRDVAPRRDVERLRYGDGDRQHLHRQLRRQLRRRPRERNWRDGDGERQHLHRQLRQSAAAASTTPGRRR